MNSHQITCPNCHTAINVDHIMEQQLQQKMETQFAAQKAEFKVYQEAQTTQIAAEKLAFDEKKKQENMLFNQRLEKEKQLQEKEIREKIVTEQALQHEQLNRELGEKTKQLQQLAQIQAENERLKREQQLQAERLKLEAEKQLSARLNEEAERIRHLEAEKHNLKIREMQKQLDDQKKLTEEMTRKQEQGSMQLQGEVLELAIEEWLSEQFPLDTIEEIKKGASGADCLQMVNTRQRQHCGRIYYESKRTKHFQPAWIEKFKHDIRLKNADVGVLITEVMPSDMPRMGMREGIWICTFEEFKSLCHAVRQTVIAVNQAMITQENQGEKAQILYQFLTSNEFRLHFEAIVEGFTQMKTDLEKEKLVYKRLWAQRDKQIEKVVDNTVTLYGSIKGIAGNAIGDIKQLELDSIATSSIAPKTSNSQFDFIDSDSIDNDDVI